MFYTRHQIVARWSSAQAIIATHSTRKGVDSWIRSMLSAHPTRSVRVVTPARGGLRRRLQADSCAEALIELCGRIWLQLYHLAHLNDRSRTPQNSSLDLSAETLRLERLLSIDSSKPAYCTFILYPHIVPRL